MNKKRFFLLAAGVVALLMSCSESFKDETAQPIETQANLRVTAQDATKGTFVAATATLRSTGQTLEVPASGPAVFTITSGVHRLLVEKTGYASTQKDVAIGTNNNGSVHVATDNYVNMPLYPTTASLTGALFYTNKNNKVVPAEGVVVRIVITTGDLVVSSFVASTDANGKYAFENLPAVGLNYTIEAFASFLPDGTIFAPVPATSGAFPLLDGSTAKYPERNLEEGFNAVEFIVSDYTKVIEIDEPIVIKFSDNVNMALVNANSVTFGQVADIKWDGKTLTLTPASKWEPNYSAVVSLNGLRSVSGKSLDDASKSLTVAINATDLSTSKIVGLKNSDDTLITYDYTTAELQWPQVKGVARNSATYNDNLNFYDWDAYEVYVAKKGTGKYSRIPIDFYGNYNTDIIRNDEDTVKIRVNFSNVAGINQVGKDVLLFRVLAKNARSKTLLSDSVEVADIIGPDISVPPHAKIASNSTIPFYSNFSGSLTPAEFSSLYSLGGRLSNTNANNSIATGTVYFNEDMNTAKLPEYSVDTVASTKNPKNKLKMVFQWIDNRELEVKIATVAGNAIEPGLVDAIYSITGVEDKAGNPVKITYSTGAAAKNSVNIRFATEVFANPCLGTNVSSEACRDFCKATPNSAYCQEWSCVAGDRFGETTGPNTAYCQVFCSENAAATCTINWPCETDPTKSTTACQNQCRDQAHKPLYCSQQEWTCNILGYGSTQCDTYCTTAPGKYKTACVNNTCISSSTTKCGTYCKAEGGTPTEKTAIAQLSACTGNWACELDYYGYNTTQCALQCRNNNELPYCSQQEWTCNSSISVPPGFGLFSNQCRTFCSDLTNEKCRTNSDQIFGASTTPTHLGYCKSLHENANVSIANIGNISNGGATGCDTYNACQISLTSPECKSYCEANSTQAVTVDCIDNVSTIYDVANGAHLAYCQMLGTNSGKNSEATMIQVCKDHFTACKIFNAFGNNKSSQCEESCMIQYGSTYNGTQWASLDADCRSTYSNECDLFGDDKSSSGTICYGFCQANPGDSVCN